MGGYFLDHIIVSVRDLPAAVRDWRELGLDATDGGTHPKTGTLNAIVRFPDGSFLELMAIEDRDTVRRQAPLLLEMIERHPDGPIDWAVRTDDLERAHAELEAKGMRPLEIRSGEGRRDSGKVARWRTFHLREPGLPFVLRYEGPPTSAPSPHGLPVEGLAAAIVQGMDASLLAGRVAAFGERGEDGRIRLMRGEAIVVEEPREHPGVVGVELLVSDEASAADYLRERGIGAVDGWVNDRRLHGLRLRLVAE